MDIDYNPFDDHLWATGGEDAHIKLWRVPDGGVKKGTKEADIDLLGHSRRINSINFHPTVSGLLVSTAADSTVKIWDIENQKVAIDIVGGHNDAVLNITWDWKGSMLATACKDTHLRVWDVRANKAVSDTIAHDGAKGFKAAWAGKHDMICTCGFSKSSERQVGVWDVRNMAKPLRMMLLDQQSGLLTPMYDPDVDLLVLTGRGDGNVRFIEITQEEPYAHLLTEWMAHSQFNDCDWMHKFVSLFLFLSSLPPPHANTFLTPLHQLTGRSVM